MDITVHGDIYTCMPEDLAQALDVEPEFNAACCKAMAAYVESCCCDPAVSESGLKAVFKATWFNIVLGAGKNEAGVPLCQAS